VSIPSTSMLVGSVLQAGAVGVVAVVALVAVVGVFLETAVVGVSCLGMM